MKFIFAVLLLSSCSLVKNNQKRGMYWQNYSSPDAPDLQKLGPNEKRIIIASTHDFRGHYSPHLGPHSTLLGGEKIIKEYFKILKSVYQNVLVVDTGNIFSSPFDVKKTQSFYSSELYDALTLGPQDFNVDPSNGITEKIQKFGESSQVPLILSNLYELKTGRIVEWQGTKSHLIKKINGISIGIIGLIPDDVVQETTVKNRVGLYVENTLKSTLKHARILRSLGADLIVVMANHLSANYLERLPPHLVDIIIGLNKGEEGTKLMNGTVIMKSMPGGQGFTYTEFIFNVKNRKINKHQTVVHNPVLFCHDFFKETNDCFSDAPKMNPLLKTEAKFLGQIIRKE